MDETQSVALQERFYELIPAFPFSLVAMVMVVMTKPTAYDQELQE